MSLVLFVQLPPPRFSFTEPPTNIPLAAGFLAAAMDSAACRGATTEILGPGAVDLLGDQALIERIVQFRPAVLAMTLYVWNVQRSLFLAANVKRILPRAKVLVGGPEVTADNEWVMRHPAVDAGVFGEGESRIVAMMEALLSGRAPRTIPGTFVKDGKKLEVNQEKVPRWDLASAAYPYLDGRISPSQDGTIFLETVRGCPFRCRYCYYHKSFPEMSFHAPSNVEKVLDFAYDPESGVREMYLMDPTFNGHPGFRDLLRSLVKRRNLKDVAVHTELRPDLLTPDDVRLLQDAGLASAEVGLQSTNPAALAAAGRTGNPDRIARGTILLKEAGIDVTTGIILGLPQDTPEGFRSTLEWLKDTGAYSVVHPFMLSVLPGTVFRQSAAELGLEYDARPPYYVKSLPTFPATAFRPALLECERVFDMEMDHIPPPSLVDSGHELCSDPRNLTYVSKWIVNPGGSDWKNVLPEVAARSTDPFTIWFRGEMDQRVMISILTRVSNMNPHSCLHVVVELPQIQDKDFFRRAMDASAVYGHFFNRCYEPLYAEGEVVNVNFWALHPDPGDPDIRDEISERYGSMAKVIWDVSFIDEGRLSQTCLPLLFSATAADNTVDFRSILDILENIQGDSPEDVLFRNRGLQDAWYSLVSKFSPAYGFSESIVSTE